MYNHVIKQYVDKFNPDKFELMEPNIFDPADVDRVKQARKLYKQLQYAHGFKLDQEKIQWNKILMGAAIGPIAGFVTSGMLANLLHAGPESRLWLTANPLFRPLLDQYPGLFAALMAEFGLIMGAEGYIRGKRMKLDATKVEKRWDAAKFTNSELVHVFEAGTPFDTRYKQTQGNELFWFPQESGLPKTALQFYDGPLKSESEYAADVEEARRRGEDPRRVSKKKQIPMAWSRFHRDGTFRLYIGEVYEDNGRFNHEPKAIYVPSHGLWTGMAIFGPTGSGKSATLALPFIDQALGYYHWVNSERDAWLFDATMAASRMRARAERQGGAEGRRLLDQAKGIQREVDFRLDKVSKGEDPFLGYEKCGLIVVEPKDEIWATQLDLCKRFDRERDYIELGVVNEKFRNFQTQTTKLQSCAKVLWSFTSDSAIQAAVVNWILGFSYQNGIAHGEKTVDLWVTVDHKDVKVPISPKNSSNVSEVIPMVSGVYGESASDEGWIARTFGESNPIRVAGRAILGGLRRSDEGQDGRPQRDDYQTLMLQQAVTNPAPWALAPAKVAQDEYGWLPFGFGVTNDPWFRSSLGQGQPPRLDTRRGQKLVLDPFQRILYLFSLMGGGAKFTAVNQDETAARFKPLTTAHGIFTWNEWQAEAGANIEARRSDIEREIPGGGEFDKSSLANVILPVPIVNPTGLVTPTVSKARRGDEKPSELETLIQAVKEALNQEPAEKKETVKLRRRIRAAAPPSIRPNERRYDFRKRYAIWQAERRKRQFDFMDGLLKVLFVQTPSLRAVEDAMAASESGKVFSRSVLEHLFLATPSGMLDAALRYALHAPGSREVVIGYLRDNGYEFYSGVAVDEDARVQRKEGVEPYDAVVLRGLRPSSAVLKQLCEANQVPFSEVEGRYSDLEGHLRLRRLEDEHRMALVLCALVTRAGFTSDVNELIRVVKQSVSADSLAQRDKNYREAAQVGSPVWAKAAIASMRAADNRLKLVYELDPRVPTVEPITDDPEDFEAVVDCSPVNVNLGPWDALWSEGVGERIWDGLGSIARATMTKAIGLYSEEESAIVRTMMPDGTASGNVRSGVEQALKMRRDDVFNGTMDYLKALETYLRVMSPYYKVNTAFPYGYSDFGGIGNCCGATKFNPLHHPDMTPEQLAGLLMGILGRNAGSGDTPFWNDSGKMITEGMASLLRAARGYMTVSDVNQMIVSDSFADIIIAQGEERIRKMRESSGGSKPGHVIRAAMVKDIWAKQYGLDESQITEAEQFGEIPAELEHLLPRSASSAEIKNLEGNLSAGRTFVTSEWRSDRGAFADKEIRSTCKLNLVNQLTPVTNGIGAYSFSPEDADEISFPTPTEMRNLGLCVATRFNYANDKKLGSLVIGMFIAAYQMMVLSAKQRQTQAKETFVRISAQLDDRRTQLKELRAEVRRLKIHMAQPKADAEALKDWFQAMYRNLEPGLSPLDKASRLMAGLMEAERQGFLLDAHGRKGARVVFESMPGVRFMESALGKRAMLMDRTGDPVAQVQENLQRLLEAEVNRRQEEDYEIADRVNRLDGKIWEYRQEILNALSELEEFPNWSRIMMFLVDEYHMFANNNARSATLTDTEFLSTSRAGKSINVFITQTPSSVKSSGMSMDLWEQWISNTLVRICLGAPNKQDQEYISDLFRGEKRKKQKDLSVNVSYEGIDLSRTDGGLRASEVGGASRSYTETEEYEKYVSPDDLARMPVMSSWVEITDGQRRVPPKLVYHPPYFLMNSKGVSRTTKEPIASKSWLALVRDGELNLRAPEDEAVRAMIGAMAMAGVDIEGDLADRDRIEDMRKREKAV